MDMCEFYLSWIVPVNYLNLQDIYELYLPWLLAGVGRNSIIITMPNLQIHVQSMTEACQFTDISYNDSFVKRVYSPNNYIPDGYYAPLVATGCTL